VSTAAACRLRMELMDCSDDRTGEDSIASTGVRAEEEQPTLASDSIHGQMQISG
jgi:hypothetical protein